MGVPKHSADDFLKNRIDARARFLYYSDRVNELTSSNKTRNKRLKPALMFTTSTASFTLILSLLVPFGISERVQTVIPLLFSLVALILSILQETGDLSDEIKKFTTLQTNYKSMGLKFDELARSTRSQSEENFELNAFNNSLSVIISMKEGVMDEESAEETTTRSKVSEKYREIAESQFSEDERKLELTPAEERFKDIVFVTVEPIS